MFLLYFLLCVQLPGRINSLRSAFYKPDAGLIQDSWIRDSGTDLNKFNSLPGYPDCPPLIENKGRFEWELGKTNKYHHFRFRSYLVSPLSGAHKLIVACKYECEVKIELQPGITESINHRDGNSRTVAWLPRTMSKALLLKKGFRYKLDVKYFDGYGSRPYFFKLGILLPNGTEVKPLDERYLRRSMEFYKLNGLLVEFFDGTQQPPSRKFSDFVILNAAKYPNNPSEFYCRSTLHDDSSKFRDNYAVRNTGYLKLAEAGSYDFNLRCNSFCEFNITKAYNQIVTLYDNKDIVSPPVSVGVLNTTIYYSLDIFLIETTGNDYLKTKWRKEPSSSYSNKWNMHQLTNLFPSETYLYIPTPWLRAENSTTLSAELTILPLLPQNDKWSSTQSYEILYHKASDPSTISSIAFTGALPITKVFTGLDKYTQYSFYTHFYGLIKSSIEHNIISGKATLRTDEDVPEDYPPNFRATVLSSTSIKLMWNPLAFDAKRNGIIIGYNIKYTVKDSLPKIWLYHRVTSASNRIVNVESLKKYTFYQFYLAANTSKGAGIYSSAIEKRTMEDVPSAPPANIIGYNTSSTSFRINWGDVPVGHRNGIITGYNIRIRESPSGSWQPHISLSLQSYEKTGLSYWTIYDVKVSAKTSIGEGVQSEIIQIRTDEDKPGGPPKNVQATAVSSSSIRCEWADIDSNLQNGIILSYEVKYQRKDKLDSLKTMKTSAKFVVLIGLDKYIEYDMSVAGATGKGVGIFSATITKRTIGDVPSKSPTSLSGGFMSATKIYATWDVIPVDGQNAVIKSYNIEYKKRDSPGEWKITSVAASKLRVEIDELDYFTVYALKVAGVTDFGAGPFTDAVYIRTDAYGPTKPPENVNGTFVNHTSIAVFWSRVPKQNRHGIILGYKISYKDSTSSSATWINDTIPNRNGSDDAVFNITLTGLKIYTPYLAKVLAYTYRGEGPFSENITVWTDDFIPEEIPKNIKRGNKTSTEVDLNWKTMDEVSGQGNGKIIGYRVKYQVVDCHADRPAGCNESEVFTIMTADAEPQIKIPRLRKFTNYSISIQVVNRKGVSNYTEPIYIQTAEDKPDGPPQKLESWPSKSDRIAVYWSPIPESLRNGIIVGYRIFYQPIDVPVRNFKRSPRSVNPFAVFGALPGEKMKEVNSSTYETVIEDLKEYSWYQIRIGALTSKGLGVTYTINGTCKQGAPVEAPSFEVFGNYDFYAVSLTWKNISRAGARGEVLGYRIHYWAIEQNDLAVFNGKISYIDVLEPNQSLEIINLQPYTTYGVIISAFTEGGIGVLSKHKRVDTCRCPKVLTSAWTELPPLVQGNQTISGIMPKYIDEAVTACCGNCTFGQGPSSIDWTHDASSENSLKHKKSAVVNAIMSGTHITVPFFRDTVEIEGSESTPYDYIPFLQTPGMAFFKRKPSRIEIGNKGATKLIDSLLSLYTLLVVQVVFIAAAGMIFWLLERGDNKDEFPDDFFYGFGSGMWLAFITMTTAGYGDIAPKTKSGRIFAIVWTLVGIVLTSLIVGQIVNSLSASTVVSASKGSSSGSKNEKVMASNETLMIAITKLRERTVSGNTSDPEFVKLSLLSGKVKKVMIEAFEAGKIKNELKHPDIFFDKLEPVDASYGVVLTSDARRMKSCLKRFVKENSQQIFNELAEYTVSFKSGSSSNLKQEMPTIVSSDAELTTLLIKYGGITLLLLIILGLIYDVTKYIRGRHKIYDQPLPVQDLFNDTDELLNGLVQNMTNKAAALDKKHTYERWRLTRMDVKDLKAMLPDLTIFHEDLREKNEEKPYYEENPYHDKKYKINYDSDDSTVDMPMDYKIS